MIQQSIDRRCRRYWWLALLVVAGCSTLGGVTKDSPPEVKQATVKERAGARWAAMIKGDIDGAYAFLSPASRQTVSPEAFAARRGATKYTAATVESVSCEAESCKVQIKLTYDYPVQGKIMRGIQTPLTETWVFDKGNAWLVYL
jgi:hypothetical protein